PEYPPSVVPYPRVEHAVHDVGDEIEEDDERGEYESEGLDHRDIVVSNRCDQESADPVDPEDLFGDDGSREDPGNLKGDESDHRYQAVAENMGGDNRSFGE